MAMRVNVVFTLFNLLFIGDIFHRLAGWLVELDVLLKSVRERRAKYECVASGSIIGSRKVLCRSCGLVVLIEAMVAIEREAVYCATFSFLSSSLTI